MPRIWIDVHTPSEVLFMRSLIPELYECGIYLTSCRHAETTDLLDGFGIANMVIGNHPVGGKIDRFMGVMDRILSLFLKVPDFDVALSLGDFYTSLISFLRRKLSISIFDNDSSYLIHDRLTMFRLSSHLICPSAISTRRLKKLGIDVQKIHQFDGYKEDVYVSGYTPDPVFMHNIPYEEFVVVRPEALFAVYVKEKKSIVSPLVRALLREGLNVVYLPRLQEDRNYVKGMKVFIPPKALYGLDLCWYSDGVLTGSGSLAREATRVGVPAISFFPGELLSVDRQLVEEGRMFHSRDVSEILHYLSLKAHGRPRLLDLQTSQAVKRQLVQIVKEILRVEEII